MDNPIFIAIGLVLAMAILFNPSIGLFLIVALMPQALIQAVGGSFLGVFTIATPIKIIGGLTFISVLLRHILERRKCDFLKKPQIIFFICFVFWIFISGFTQPSFFTKENFTMFVSFAILGFIILSLIRDVNQFKTALWVGFISILVICINTIITYLRYGSVIRMGGSGYGPNEFAIYLLPFIGVTLYGIFSEQKTFRKLCLFIISIACIFALVTTFSRGGIIGLGGIFLFSALKAKKKIKVFLFLLILSFAFVNILPATMKERLKKTQISETSVGDEAIDSATRRYYLALAAWRMFLANPIVGVGVGNYYWECRNYAPLIAGRAHNMYLEIMAELGIIGIFLFIGILFFTFKSLNKIIKTNSPLVGYAKGLYIGLVGFLVAAIFLHAQQEKVLWFVVFMAAALENIALKHDRRTTHVAK